jgi:hypothetical protein
VEPFCGFRRKRNHLEIVPTMNAILNCVKVGVTILACCMANALLAAESSVYHPAGAPANPKVRAQWNAYHDYAAATEMLKQMTAAHPELCRLQSLGTSYGGREMWVLTIADFNAGEIKDRAAFWIDGGIHANEVQATEVALYTAWYLLESFERSPFVKRLLTERAFYVMPMMSPDSRDEHMYKPNSTHSPRTGMRPFDDDGDGLVDEDGPDDLDGDGHITQMRIRDPHGRVKPHPDHPDLMIDAKPDEKGEFAGIRSEGFDNDGDGRVDEDGDGSYDPNRNWPWNWEPQYVQGGAHLYPLSLLEDRMVSDFFAAHSHIAGAQSYHNAGGMILRGPGAKEDAFTAEDTEVLKAIARRGEELLPGYRSMEVAHELYEVYGGEVDWLYNGHGVLAFTNELFTPFNYFRQKSEGGGFFGPPEQTHQFNKYLLFGDGLVNWHEVDHPQFGKVEVGGMKKNWIRQPPSFLLEEECHRNMAFTFYHADQMPKVKVDEVTVKQLGGGILEVSATVSNERMIPTRVAIDVKNKLNPPDRVRILGKGLKVLAGFTSDRRLFDRLKEQKRKPEVLLVDTIPGMEARYVRWLVQGEGPFTVEVNSTKGGVSRDSWAK